MAKQFKDLLEESKLFQIATDARELLCKMESSSHWTETMKEGLKQYASTHSNVEELAFKAALHFHIFWVCGEYLFETLLLPISVLAEKIGSCDASQEDYRYKVISMF